MNAIQNKIEMKLIALLKPSSSMHLCQQKQVQRDVYDETN